MLAVRFHGIGDVRAEKVPPITYTPEQALIKVLYGGVCGSDLHIYREGMFIEHTPEIMGHEFCGRIITAPPHSGLREGDLVVGDPRVACGDCPACRDKKANRCDKLGFIGEVRPGCFAQLLALEPEKLLVLGHDTDPRQAALAEPLAVAVHACRNMNAAPDEQALILGAGPIGLLIAWLLKREYKLSRVCIADVDDYRLSFAPETGADEAGPDLSSFAPYSDLLIDAAGSVPALAKLVEQGKHGARLHISAIYEREPAFDLNLLVAKEMSIVGNNNYDRRDLEEAARLIENGADLSWLISRIVPADEAADVFAGLAAPQKRDMKVLLDFIQ